MTFDRCQFDHRYRKGQWAKDSLAAQVTSDELVGGMQAFRAAGRTTRWIPAFYANDAQLRAVLAQAVIGYCFGGGRVPSDVAGDLKTLTMIASERLADLESGRKAWNVTMNHLAAVQEAGSYLAFIAGISYRAWRLRWHSPDIARESGITVHSVSKILNRLVMYAERFGFPTYRPRWVESREPTKTMTIRRCDHGPDAVRQGKKGPYCIECRRAYHRKYKREYRTGMRRINVARAET